MLHISRFVGSEYGVHDTEDDIEEVVPIGSLSKSLIDGVEIAGVQTRIVRTGAGCVNSISSVKVVQDPATISPIQTKAKTLLHTDIVVFRQAIANIVWRPERITKPVQLRLSDFGTSCADYMLYGNVYWGSPVMEFVLDDKIDVSLLALDCNAFLGSIGLVLNIEEVTREDTVELVYQAVWNSIGAKKNLSLIFDYVRDTPERTRYWREKIGF